MRSVNAMWRWLGRRVLLAAALLAVAACGGPDGSAADADVDGGAGAEVASADAVAPNTLTEAERADGWALLFDGRTTDGWRRYGGTGVPETWIVRDGELTLQTSGGNMDGGDIVTTEEFTDFELVFDFKVGPSGNSGVFYRVQEHEGYGLWQVAPEYQVLDDPAYPASDEWDPRTHRTGENYDLHATEDRPVRPIGEWNTGRIVVDGTRVEHWLNGVMTVSYELYSPDWEARVAASKFATEDPYARAPSGAIGLQDHGTPVWYRNLKIRRR